MEERLTNEVKSLQLIGDINHSHFECTTFFMVRTLFANVHILPNPRNRPLPVTLPYTRVPSAAHYQAYGCSFTVSFFRVCLLVPQQSLHKCGSSSESPSNPLQLLPTAAPYLIKVSKSGAATRLALNHICHKYPCTNSSCTIALHHAHHEDPNRTLTLPLNYTSDLIYRTLHAGPCGVVGHMDATVAVRLAPGYGGAQSCRRLGQLVHRTNARAHFFVPIERRERANVAPASMEKRTFRASNRRQNESEVEVGCYASVWVPRSVTHCLRDAHQCNPGFGPS